MDKIWYRNLV